MAVFPGLIEGRSETIRGAESAPLCAPDHPIFAAKTTPNSRNDAESAPFGCPPDPFRVWSS